MSLILYTAPLDKTGKEIMVAIKTQLPGKSVECCSTVNSFALKLSELKNNKKMAVIVPENEEKLMDIYSMQNLFNGVPVVLVLPNKEKLTVAMGYRLKPQLMCYRESGIVEVMSKLLDTVKRLQ